MAVTTPSIPGVPVGEVLDGYRVGVVDEHAVRFAAVVLFAVGATGWTIALFTEDFTLARGFAVLFLGEMGIRIGLAARLAPLYAIGSRIFARRGPSWVGAPQKAFAWGLGFAFSLSACFAFGWLGLPALALTICGVCLVLLGAEALAGWCIGCAVYGRLWPEKTFHCSNNSCEVHKH